MESSSLLLQNESTTTPAGNNQSTTLAVVHKKNKRNPTLKGNNNTPTSPVSSFVLTEARSDFDSTCVLSVGGSTIDMAKDARFMAN